MEILVAFVANWQHTSRSKQKENIKPTSPKSSPLAPSLGSCTGIPRAAFSQKFNYVTHSQILAEFFWSYGHITDARRGWDTNVTLADPAEVRDFEKNVPTLVKEKVGGRPNLPDYKVTSSGKPCPTHKMVAHFAKENREAMLFTQRAFSETTSPCGRATRGYLAYEAKKREL